MRRTAGIALVSFVCALAGCNVRFQRPGTTPASHPPGATAPPAPPPPPKSVGTGVALAVVGSAVPAIAFGIGMSIDDLDTRSDVVIGSIVGGLVLPSLGLIYAGRKKSPGMYPRSAALVTLIVGALVDGLGDSKEANTYYGVTAALYGAGCIIDIAVTPGAVRDWNARTGATVTLVPTAVPGGAGLALGGRF